MKKQITSSYRISGVYKLIIDETPFFYIGSSADLVIRRRKHGFHLIAGTHHNKKLQKAFDVHKKYSFEVLEFCDPKNKIEVEQKHVSANKDNQFMCNCGPDVRNTSAYRNLSDEVRGFLRENWQINKHKLLPSVTGGRNWRAKKVINIKTGKVFDCTGEAFVESGFTFTLDNFQKYLNPKVKDSTNRTNYMYLSDYLANKECTMEDFLKNRKSA